MKSIDWAGLSYITASESNLRCAQVTARRSCSQLSESTLIYFTSKVRMNIDDMKTSCWSLWSVNRI